MQRISSPLTDLLFESSTFFQFYFAEVPHRLFWEDLSLALEQQNKVIELYVSNEVYSYLIADIFVQNELRKLWANGLDIFVDDHIGDDSYVVVENSSYFIISTEHAVWNALSIESSIISKVDLVSEPDTPPLRSFFKETKGNISVLFPDKPLLESDVFTVEIDQSDYEKVLLNDDLIQLNEKLTFKAVQSGWWIFTFYNKKYIKKIARYLSVYETLKIEAEVKVFNVISKRYESIQVIDSAEPVYAFTELTKVQLSWHVDVADEVNVVPFNLSGLIGHVNFDVKDDLQIYIRAKLGSKSTTKSISIRSICEISQDHTIALETYDYMVDAMIPEIQKWRKNLVNDYSALLQKRDELEKSVVNNLNEFRKRSNLNPHIGKIKLIDSFNNMKLQVMKQLRTLSKE